MIKHTNPIKEKFTFFIMNIIEYFREIIKNYQTKKDTQIVSRTNKNYSENKSSNYLENQANNNPEEGIFTWYD
jgi:hypothetical protein